MNSRSYFLKLIFAAQLAVCLASTVRADVTASCADDFSNLAVRTRVEWVQTNVKVGSEVSVPDPMTLNGIGTVIAKVIEVNDFELRYSFKHEGKIETGTLFKNEFSLVQPVSKQERKWAAQIEREELEIEKYVPIPAPKEPIGLSKLTEAKSKELAQLKKLGVEVTATELPSTVSETVETVQGQLVKTEVRGFVFEVKDLPPPVSKGSWHTPAFQHPEMRAYKTEMERLGYRLVVDPTLLPYGAGGVFRGQPKIIGITAYAPWSLFIHEFEHLKFHEFQVGAAKYKAWSESDAGVQRLPKDLLSVLGEKKALFIAKMERRGMPELATNETLAVRAEMRTMGYGMYVPWSYVQEIAIDARKYALKYQLTGLLRIHPRDRTFAQTSLLNKARLEMKALEGLTSPAPLIFTTAVAGGALVAALEAKREQIKEIIYSDNEAVVFIRDNLNRWTKLTPSPASEKKSTSGGSRRPSSTLRE